MKKKSTIIISAIVVIVALIIGGIYYFKEKNDDKAVEKAAQNWLSTLEKQQFEKLPAIVTSKSIEKQGYSNEELVAKYTNIFSGIGVDRVTISDMKIVDQFVTYKMKLHTSIGDTSNFLYKAKIVKAKDQYKIAWEPNLIFPNMKATDKISFTNQPAKRGSIKDANGLDLATMAKMFQAGIIPKELGVNEARTKNIEKIARFLDVPTSTIEKNLAQKWVKDDLFVPIKVVEDESVQKFDGLQYKAIETRVYPLKEAAANLIGYIGKVTAEDLEKNPALGMDSYVGKTGLERTYDKELRGTDGGTISLTDEAGKVKEALLNSEVENGATIKLTIDSILQKDAYDALEKSVGSTVIMEPKTGALLTLVTKPSFNPNLMTQGISQQQYDEYANDPNKPFTNRYSQRYAPGSTMKAITATIGLDAGTLKESTVRKIEGLQWQKNSSWGNYKVTRVTDNPTVDYKKALIYSDNIFFAQEGLNMGEKTLRKGLEKFGFGKKFDLPFAMEPAQISTTKKFKNDIALADTAYGQGELLTSPIQQAVAYSAFANDGKIVSPHLIYKEQSATTQAASKESINKVNDALQQVVDNPKGTAHKLYDKNISLAAKTGTAELKMEQGTEGTENSFIFAFNRKKENYLLVSFIEDHKNSGKTATELAKKLLPELNKLNYSEK